MNSAEIENSAVPPSGDSTSSDTDEHLASSDYEAASGEDRLAQELYRHSSTDAAAAASETSAAAASAARALADSAQEKLTQATSALSEQIRKVSSYFENRGVEEVVGDARRLVQRNPALFIAGGVVVGFALSRLLTGVEQRRTGRRR